MLLIYAFQNPLFFLYFVISILLAITIHEFSHAWIANFLGDPTAKVAGRLSLNPFSHLDFFGTLMLFIAGFGWGKPVPFNPYLFRRGGKAAPFLVALAGPFSNFLLALLLSFSFRIIFTHFGNSPLANLIYIIIYFNIILMIFNLLPIPPLDGSKIFYLIPGISEESIQNLERIGIFILFAFILLGGWRIIPPIVNFILVNILRLPVLSI